MRDIDAKKITETIKQLCIKANYELSEDVLHALTMSLGKESSRAGKEVIRDIVKNAEIARRNGYPICQDTGMAVVFAEVGQDVRIVNGDLDAAINEGVKRAYKEGYLRKSIVNDPFMRRNTGDNAPAMIHHHIVPGDKIKLTLMAKGGGAENKSSFKMFKPTAGREEIMGFIMDIVKNAGGDACPPLIIGIGIGGNLEGSALLAKKALLRKVGQKNRDRDTAKFEARVLKELNDSGIGPGGLGGDITALSVAIEKAPCHIASLPVTVNMDCHAHRVRHEVI